MSSKVGPAFVAVASFFFLYRFFLPPPLSPVFSPLSATSLSHSLRPDYVRHAAVVPRSVTVLLPAWQVLVIAPTSRNNNLSCVFPGHNSLSSPATLSGIMNLSGTLSGIMNLSGTLSGIMTLSGRNRTAFKCTLPPPLRKRPFSQPVLTDSLEKALPSPAGLEMPMWNYLVYDSMTTEDDVIVFAKGINNRQGKNVPRQQLGCLFDGVVSVSTNVLTAVQEVFRCKLPNNNLTEFGGKVTLQLNDKTASSVVPTVAFYSPPLAAGPDGSKALVCACTMVRNAAKFLREWVRYHAGIGVEKFVLYDNESDDELAEVVRELVDEGGFDVTTVFWVWPKTQEAGFSHCAVVYNHTCTWMMYMDVDEFVYSPRWANESRPSNQMLGSMVVQATGGMIGQVKIGCYEFGPSDQREHPRDGVTQGYSCRMREANRHKSIVLLDAVDPSLQNAVHHFRLKPGYRSVQMKVEDAVINHYKYQAWSEFKTKFRRRVSAYVVDWTRSVNLASKDRTPGLGVVPVEPHDWPERFCEVHDNNLRDLTKLWFRDNSSSLRYMA